MTAEAHAQALRGQLDSAIAHASELTAWGVACAWLLRLHGGPEPQHNLDLDVREAAAARAIDVHRARYAMLRNDVAQVDACAHRLHQRAQSTLEDGWALVVSGWAQILRGAPATSDAQTAYRIAREASEPALVVEATTVSALCSMIDGNIAEALKLARRAVRMAGTERLWCSHFMAGIVLARLRRLSGHPHLASRILRTLMNASRAPWHEWCCWERLLAGESEVVTTHTTKSQASSTLERFRRALKSSCHPDLPTGIALWSRDHADVFAVIDGRDGTAEVAAWVQGATTETPRRLHGLIDSAQLAAPRVLVLPHARARRVFGWMAMDTKPLPLSGAQPGRIEVVIAALALADEGLHGPDLFRAAYGFEYRDRLHANTFKTLRHRARSHLGDAGCIERHNSRYQLVPTRAFTVADPRCHHPLEELMLRHLARVADGAKSTAQALDVPLRTVQTAMKGLVANGACSPSRRGRRVVYEIEDTTFSEPTQSLSPG